MEKIQLTVLLWVKFCMNFPDIKEVLKWVCEKTNQGWLYDHYHSKFLHLYESVGSNGVMNAFYCECDRDIREALVEYAITVWAPIGMFDTYNKNKHILDL